MQLRYVFIPVVAFVVLFSSFVPQTSAQSELAAILEVLSPGVEVRRVNTANWIPVNVEAIVGVGDTIRTDDTGHARITFFADGIDTDILPNTEYEILAFEGNAEAFKIMVEVLIGQTTQRLNRLLGENSTYDVSTPGMTLAARGTEFAIRVEITGRAAMLVTEGTVHAANDSSAADVPAEFGVRAEVAGPLSDVVRAKTFEELDSALDGCQVQVEMQDDVWANVRTGPGLDFPRVGGIDPTQLTQFIGINERGDWYRIPYRGGYGWIFASNVEIIGNCPVLRVFEEDTVDEDVTLYEALGDAVQLDDLLADAPASTPVPSAEEDTPQ